MKKLIKRIVPILLSVFMLFGVLDTPVYASSTEENSDGENSDKEGSQSLNVRPFSVQVLLSMYQMAQVMQSVRL